MKRKTTLHWVLCAAVLLAAVGLATGIAPAQTGGGVMSSAAGHYHLIGTIDQPGSTILSGGHYQLTDMTLSYAQGNAWQESDLASGGGYHLEELTNPGLTGNGCCCVYLPCVKR